MPVEQFESTSASDFLCLFKPGDIVKWKPIDRVAYDEAVADVEAGRFAPIIRDVAFSLTEFNRDIDGYNRKLEGVLHGH
jgi:urea carboxylase